MLLLHRRCCLVSDGLFPKGLSTQNILSAWDQPHSYVNLIYWHTVWTLTWRNQIGVSDGLRWQGLGLLAPLTSPRYTSYPVFEFPTGSRSCSPVSINMLMTGVEGMEGREEEHACHAVKFPLCVRWMAERRRLRLWAFLKLLESPSPPHPCPLRLFSAWWFRALPQQLHCCTLNPGAKEGELLMWNYFHWT